MNSLMSILRRAVLSAAAITGLSVMAMSTAAACGFTAWPERNTVENAQACGPEDNCPRYQGLCSFESDAGSTNFVAHTANNDDFFVRFFMFPQSLTGDGSVMVFDAEGTNATVLLNRSGSNLTLSLEGSTGTAAITANRWVEVKVSWAAGRAVTLEAGGNSVTGPVGTGGGMTNGNLGVLDGGDLSGSIFFDSYVANRTSEPAALVNCNIDGDDNDAFNALDALALVDEIFGAGLASGTPDCNGDGAINALDALALVDLIFQ